MRNVPKHIVAILICILISMNSSWADSLTAEFNCEADCFDLVIEGGLAPYEVVWQKKFSGLGYVDLQDWPKVAPTGNSGFEDLCDVSNGYYRVIVIDANCGSLSLLVNKSECTCDEANYLNNPIPLISHNCTDNGQDGHIALLTSSSYQFSWSNGSNEQYISNLENGEYSVTITNPSTQCFSTFAYEITTISEIQINLIDVESSCETSSTGSLEVEYRGYSGLTSSWWDDLGPSSLNHSLNRENLPAGEYCLNVVNSCNTAKECFTVELNEIIVLSTLDYGCDDNTGSILINISGTNPPFIIEWENGSSKASLANLNYGEYDVTITDQEGCEHDQENFQPSLQ